MTVTAVRTKLKAIQALRALFLQSTNFQIRYDACHERGWTDSYLLTVDELQVGYGSVKGQVKAGFGVCGFMLAGTAVKPHVA